MNLKKLQAALQRGEASGSQARGYRKAAAVIFFREWLEMT